ncbi:MAG: glycosyltransferase [Tenuifilaceae bacterium]|jgi:glycosyltransferase involved in cell wall biosynthesis|nr:glycosyltransferase [Tenuifilaceae bacterium]
MARIYLLTTSDIVSDQRVHRSAITLAAEGHRVTVVGRKLSKETSEISRTYAVFQFNLPFKKGVFFYLSFNLWAFLYLIFHRFDLVVANDLDTLLAARLSAAFKRKKVLYDSHELFTELPELINRKVKRYIWFVLEKLLTKGLPACIAVSDGVARHLENRYGVRCIVIRNLPFSRNAEEHQSWINKPIKVIIYQGSLNIGRGLERLIQAMQWVDNAELIIAGVGDIQSKLVEISMTRGLSDRVKFLGKIPLEELHGITQTASLGVSLEEDMGLNYRYALPNKLFDYIQAGIPVLVSDLPEMVAIVSKYDVGEALPSNCAPQLLSEKLNQLLNDNIKMNTWHVNAKNAALELNWEKESGKLVSIVNEILNT